MTENVFARVLEHNNWANQQIIQLCIGLSEAQLEAEPHSATRGSIRQTLLHLVRSQQYYLGLLTLPPAERVYPPLLWDELAESARRSGEGLLALAGEASGSYLEQRLQTRDGYVVEPWVVMVQVINHATEHREQLKSMLTALGMTPADLSGWDYGEAVQALVPPPA